MSRIFHIGLSLAMSFAIVGSQSDSPAHAAGKKPSRPVLSEVKVVPSGGGKVNLVVSLKASVPSGGKAIKSTKVTASGKSCTVPKASGSCTLKGVKWSGSTKLKALSRNSSGTGKVTSLSLPRSTKYWSKATGPCTIIGTSGADRLIGTSGADRICGMSGNDTLIGLNGDDVLFGMGGNDVLWGGNEGQVSPSKAVNNTVSQFSTSDGNDAIDGGSGTDDMSGGSGSNTCSGGGNWWLDSDVLDPDSCGDVTAPHVVSVKPRTTLAVTGINSTSANVVFEIEVMDDLSGITDGAYLSYMFDNRTLSISSSTIEAIESSPDGRILHGKIIANIEIPRFQPHGSYWFLTVQVYDAIKNEWFLGRGWYDNGKPTPWVIMETGKKVINKAVPPFRVPGNITVK